MGRRTAVNSLRTKRIDSVKSHLFMRLVFYNCLESISYSVIAVVWRAAAVRPGNAGMLFASLEVDANHIAGVADAGQWGCRTIPFGVPIPLEPYVTIGYIQKTDIDDISKKMLAFSVVLYRCGHRLLKKSNFIADLL